MGGAVDTTAAQTVAGRERRPPSLYVVLTLLLAAANVLLIGQNLQLRRQLRPAAMGEFLSAGDQVPALEGRSRSGDTVTLAYGLDSENTLLLFLSPSCPYCEELFPMWQRLIEKAAESGYRILVVVREDESPSAVDEYLGKWEVSFLDVVYVPRETIDVYGLYATPITLVVAGEGVVERAWVGAWDEEQVASVDEYFGTSIGQ